MLSLRACLCIGRVAQRNRSLSSNQLLLKKGQSKCGMVKVICCQSQSGRESVSEYSQANCGNSAGAAGKHALDREFDPVAELMTILFKEATQPSPCWKRSLEGRGMYMKAV